MTKLSRSIKSVLLISVVLFGFYLGLGWITMRRSAMTRYELTPYKKSKVYASERNSTQNSPTSRQTPSRSGPWVILATTNNAFLDFTENWLESLKRSGIQDHVTIIAEDEATHKILASRNDMDVDVVMTSKIDLPARDLPFGSKDYIHLVNKRPNYILMYLAKGFDVLFTDVDTVWLQNPLPFFKGDYDVYFERDVYDDKQKPDVVCAGFAYYKATNATINLIRKWVASIQVKPQVNDQILLNSLLRNKTIRNTLKINYLDQRQFPNGKDYFNIKWREKHADVQPVVVHNNWIIGHDKKIERFMNVSMWYL